MKKEDLFYLKNKKTFVLLGIVSTAVLVFFVSMAVILFIAMHLQKPDCQKVSAKIISVRKVLKDYTRFGSNGFTIEVIVEYNGKKYKVEGINDGEISKYQGNYALGQPVEVYLADNGKMYSSKNAVKNSTILGHFYFFFLMGSLLLTFITGVSWGCLVEAKKVEKRIGATEDTN